MLEWHPNTQALADALAENVEAGLRGGEEEVEAANPYGCNQYGEGWALPHNGMERVRKADLAKKKEEEESKRLAEQWHKEEEKTKEKFHPANSIKEAEDFAKSLGIPVVNYKGLDLETVNTLNERLQETIKTFPETIQKLKYVGSAQGRKAAQEPIVRQYYEKNSRLKTL